MKNSCVFIILFLTINCARAQQDSLTFNQEIGVTARPFGDSIQLRWGPMTSSMWMIGNINGYTIERFIMVRDGKVLREPEKSILNTTPIKPLQEDQWKKYDRYHAIAAQALFGARFEVDLSKTDVFTIVNKVKENEQRFAFALFCADMSPAVAKASGLWFTDKNVKKDEKYLYRVILNSAEKQTGSIFVGPADAYELIAPINLKTKFEGSVVSLRWDQSQFASYTAYIVERSTDGKTFKPISDEPLLTITPPNAEESRYQQAIDSLPDITKTYYYRVKGLTPFGEQSQPSQVSSGKGSLVISDVPYIRHGENINNSLIRLTWEFSNQYTPAIKGFIVERSAKPKVGFEIISPQTAPSNSRTFDDQHPMRVNYYRVTAFGLNGEKYASPIYLVNLVDSIPPATPVGLKGTINEDGVTSISWQPNSEEDIYGYRIYKSNFKEEELAQMTTEPITQTFFTDSVNLNTLSDAVWYSVMAIDRNQNHSKPSGPIMIALPDKIKPQPVTFLPVTSDDNSVNLSWTRSGSLDVVKYILYRRTSEQTEWQVIATMEAKQDTLFSYKDLGASSDLDNFYTVIAFDRSDLASEEALQVSSRKIYNSLKSPIRWRQAKIMEDEKQIVLSWTYDLSNLSSFKVYKSAGDGSLVLYKTLPHDNKTFTDKYSAEKKVTYRILATFLNGSKSELSDELIVNIN